MANKKISGIFFSATVPPDKFSSLGLFQSFFGVDIPGEPCRGALISEGPHRAGLSLKKKKKRKTQHNMCKESEMRASRSISVTIEDGERQEPKVAIVPSAEEDLVKSGKDLKQSVNNIS